MNIFYFYQQSTNLVLFSVINHNWRLVQIWFVPVDFSFLNFINKLNPTTGGKLSWKPQLDDPKKLSWGSGQGPTRVPRGQRDAEEDKTSSEEDEFEGLIKTRRDRLQLPAGRVCCYIYKILNKCFCTCMYFKWNVSLFCK